jgi:hypothetical protein
MRAVERAERVGGSLIVSHADLPPNTSFAAAAPPGNATSFH